MNIDPTIFRSYDIRGIVDKDLTLDAVERIGAAYGTIASEKNLQRVTVGRDCRESSPRLFTALVRGLNSAGIDVVDVGTVATPMQYFSMHHFKADGGIQITGSHNPPEYNGLKISLGGESLHGEMIQRVGALAQNGPFASGKGSLTAGDIVTPYTRFCIGTARVGSRRLRVVVDGGNGTAGPFAMPIYRQLGADVYGLYIDMDPTFPNHHPDPTVEENLVDLRREVIDQRADLGIAFDGDGDRIGVIDEKGGILWGDQLMILFSRAVLREKPGATIVGEVKCSKTLYDDIARHGGRGIMWKTGHSLIKSKMKEVSAELAGEMSGHIFFKHRYFGFDDATYAGLRLIEILSSTDKPLSSLLSDVPRTFTTPEIRVDCPEALKFPLISAAIVHFKNLGHDVIDIDGARVTFADGWGLVRASNTQPLLVLRFEAESAERLAEIRSYVEGEIEKLRRAL